MSEESRCVALRFVFWPQRRAKYCIPRDLLKTILKPQTVQKALLLLCKSMEIVTITVTTIEFIANMRQSKHCDVSKELEFIAKHVIIKSLQYA